ncbi:MAG TPA: hypothetical protein VLR26_15650 [Frankiaceae bacterium]|nr:hypothetical protein [Frankiaceae bacterium]
MDEKLLALAATQHGLLTSAQIAAAGHEHLFRRRLRSQEWVKEQPSVLRPAFWNPTFAARVTAVRLAIKAVGPATGWCFSHTTAARLAKLKVPESDAIHVLLPVARRKLALAGVTRHFSERPLRTMRIVDEPVPFPTQTIVQCAVVLPRDDLLTLVEDSIRTGQVSLPLLFDGCERGVSGSAALRSVLYEISAEGTDRWMRRLVRLLVAAGLPRPALEVPVYDNRRLRAQLDGFYEDAKLALEVDDWETHGSRSAQERDRQRDRWLFDTRGIVTLRFMPREIRRRPAQVVNDIDQAYRRRLGRGSGRDPARSTDP